ncbi:MAG TPA: tetratricopeptide repeat protein, partial [Acidobacteriaceae bacterium]|nr:tetratricopeptide repeat protein [Acidobacteriaceae bacterium]
YLSEAETAIAHQQYDHAGALLNKAEALEPADSLENARIAYDRGYIEQAQHQNATAEANYRKAGQIDPKQFESHAALGHLLASEQRWAEARHQLETAVTLQPASGDAHQMVASAARTLARVDAEMHDASAASDALLVALQLTPEQPDDRLFAAQLAEDVGNYDGAGKEYQKILAKDPTSVAATEGLARALIHEGKFQDAETALQPALKQEPNDPTLLALSVTALAGQGNTSAAESQLESLHQQNPDQPAVTRMLADLYSSAGHPDKATPLYRQLLANDGNNPDLLTAAAENQMHQQQWAQAVDTFQKSLQIQPAQEDAWSGLAFAAWRNGQYPLVLTALDHRSQTLSDSPATLFLRATALDHLHHTKRAIQYYQKFLAAAHDQYPDEVQQTRQRLKALEK